MPELGSGSHMTVWKARTSSTRLSLSGILFALIGNRKTRVIALVASAFTLVVAFLDAIA
jgi:hypothetical protein